MAYCTHMAETTELAEAPEPKILLGARCQTGEEAWKPGLWEVDRLSCWPDWLRTEGPLQTALMVHPCLHTQAARVAAVAHGPSEVGRELHQWKGPVYAASLRRIRLHHSGTLTIDCVARGRGLNGADRAGTALSALEMPSRPLPSSPLLLLTHLGCDAPICSSAGLFRFFGQGKVGVGGRGSKSSQ